MDRDDGPDPIPDADIPAGADEFGRLFRTYNALVQTERDRQEAARRLAEQERLVSLGRLASSVAHEINNPLGGLLNALDTLKRHGNRPGVTARSIALLERGLGGIRDVVRAMIETYRPGTAESALSAADLEDLRLLIAPEIRRRDQTLHWTIEPGACDAIDIPGAPVRQAVLNLLLNASAAAGQGGHVRLAAAQDGATLAVSVANSGQNMPPAARRLLETGAGDLPGGGVGLRVVSDRTRSIGGADPRRDRRRGHPRHAHRPARRGRGEGGLMLSGRRIAIVEDDEIMGASLVQRLELEGAQPTWWRRGADAAAALRSARAPFDAVVCDIRLPDRDGEAVFREAATAAPPPPFLFITALRRHRAGGAPAARGRRRLPDQAVRDRRLPRSRSPPSPARPRTSARPARSASRRRCARSRTPSAASLDPTCRS